MRRQIIYVYTDSHAKVREMASYLIMTLSYQCVKIVNRKFWRKFSFLLRTNREIHI